MWAIATIYQLRIHIYSTSHDLPTVIPFDTNYTHTIYLHYDHKKIHFSSLTPIPNQTADTTQIAPLHTHQLVRTTTEDEDVESEDQQPDLIPRPCLNSNPIELQVMILPIDQLQPVISFSSHVAAVNYLQSQLQQHHNWINHQLQHLRQLEKHQPSLHVGFTTIQLELHLLISDPDNYSPIFPTTELYHMLYYTPHVGFFIPSPSNNNQIELQHISNNNEFRRFSTATLLSYVNNTPLVCLITDSTFSIFHIKDTYIQQMVINSNDIQPPPTPQSLTKTSKRFKYKDDRTLTSTKFKRLKIFKTTATQRAAARYWYRLHRQPKKTGIIHLLNQNPNFDIQQLLQSKATASLPLIIPATTTKQWSEVLDYKQTELGTTTTNKRKRTDQLPTAINPYPPAKKVNTETKEARFIRLRVNREYKFRRKQLQQNDKTQSSISTTTPTSLALTLQQPSLDVTKHKVNRKRNQPDTPTIFNSEKPPTKIFKKSETVLRQHREWYLRNRISTLDKAKAKRDANKTNKTNVLEPTLQPPSLDVVSTTLTSTITPILARNQSKCAPPTTTPILEPTVPQPSVEVVATNIPPISTLTPILRPNKRKIDASTTTSITDYFTKKTKPNNDDDKPP